MDYKNRFEGIVRLGGWGSVGEVMLAGVVVMRERNLSAGGSSSATKQWRRFP